MNSYWVVHVSAQKITETAKSLKNCYFVFILNCKSTTEMIHQERVGRLSHAVTERAVGKWCQRLSLVFALQEDILNIQGGPAKVKPTYIFAGNI